MNVQYACCTGLDMHKKTVLACVRRLSCSDRNAILPGEHTLTKTDAGERTYKSVVTLRTAGKWTRAATDPTGRAQPGSATVIARPFSE